MLFSNKTWRDIVLTLVFASFTVGLYFVPTGFEGKTDNVVRCRGEVVSVDDTGIQRLGLIRVGEQSLEMVMLDGPFRGERMSGFNQLLGQMDRDKLFRLGDVAHVVLSLGPDGKVVNVNPQDHYRLGLEVFLLGIFACLLLAFGGWTGFKSLLSFLFTGMVLWKVLVPLLLKGVDPIALVLGITSMLCAAIIFLVAGLNRVGIAAFLGSFLGVLCSCLLSIYFTRAFHLHGAVMPFAETLLYAGYSHLDITSVYIAAVFLASSGAVMDLAMDVATSIGEVTAKNPGLSRLEAIWSGVRVGRAVVGTMTTTLLLAYSGGFVTLLMAFMAQGIPLETTFNFVYVAAEVLKTLVGSFGLVTVGPFTAVVGGVLLAGRRPAHGIIP